MPFKPRAATKLLKDFEVAEMLGVSLNTVWRSVHRGDIPKPVIFGRNTRWRLTDVEAAIDDWQAGSVPIMADTLREQHFWR